MNERQITFLEKAKTHAHSKNGECLSDFYKNNQTKLLWKCHVGEHKAWEASSDSVLTAGTWCPECAIQARRFVNEEGLERARQYAKSKGGACLSTELDGRSGKLLWKCHVEEHQAWEVDYDKIISGNRWCIQCGRESAGNIRKLKDGLKQAKEHAISKNGQCLSEDYLGARQHMTWKCENPAHDPWSANYNSVVTLGSWCPHCFREDRNISENRVRSIFETYFKTSFPSVRPGWNINPWTNQLLELDGYCEEFNIAFEHDGEHHFELTRGKGVKDLAYQKFKDEQKRKNCQKNDVLLINIPIIEKNKRSDFDAMLAHVASICANNGLEMSFSPDQLQELKQRFSK
ncbi:zinc-ribbon domain-containing protein [Burkholderia contaminans]|uniref:zinc-ribbon domain-containing protein n=1 Tax=Burkholderia contaminans TaxID=488447 RepID=UPI00158D7686|nr:hypothetical protein [Burkholderia contaminans]